PSPTPQSRQGEETARRIAETVLPPRDLVDLAGRLLHGGRSLPRIAAQTAPTRTVGHQARFWVSDEDRMRQVTATLRVVTPHLYMYVEDGASVDQGDLERAAQTFEDKIYPTCRRIFGQEWSPGVDGDPHLVILHTYLAEASGYFSSMNEVPQEVNSYSNQCEMFYMDLGSLIVGSRAYLSTLAHEFQHMIHWYLDPRSDAWADEGLSQMAEEACGYDASDLVWAFLDNPDLQLTTWSDDPSSALPHYAASYLWFRYLTHRLGGMEALGSLLDPAVDNLTAVERALERAGYRPVVPAPRLFDAFFADWALANYLNDPTVGDGRYAYDPNLMLIPPWPAERVYRLPKTLTTTVYPYATDYIEVESLQSGRLRLSFDGAERLPLLPIAPHSGAHFWWSNRGDQADSTLTRALDLSGTERATLRFWTAYEIEADYDYAYIEISTDGGHAWQMLPGRYTTTSNPNGNNFGRGYTGTSGGGERAVWVQEEIDLSPFAGQPILLRFELVTDDAYNAPGLALDDLEIPEIGLFDDMESPAGWEAGGFVWVDNTVPVHFLVQVAAESDAETALYFLPLDAEGRGELLIPDYGEKIYRVMVLVSAVAPATTEPAPYTLTLSLE
ncbi:MAG: hypothetical protein ACP5NB_13575, partial [Chloroflexia bacterium]